MRTVRDAARDYIARGWPVVQLRPGTKIPATAHGKNDASLDPTVIDGWFPNGSTAGVGIVTGEASALVVVDVDPRNGGDASLEALEARYGSLPATLEAHTGGGGRHLIYSLPAGVTGLRDRPNVGGFKGVDLKAGGYIVAAPSGHPSGGIYAWANDNAPAHAPAFLVALGRKTAPSRPPTEIGSIAEGGRNDALFRKACHFRGAGLSGDTLQAAVAAENLANCQPPLSAEEVGQVVLSAMRYEPNAAPLSDLGLSRILVASLDGNARFDHVAGCWFVWSGRVWQRDRDGVIMRYAKAAADKLAADAELITDSDARKQARRVAKNAASASRLAATIDLAKSEPGVAISSDAFDTNPYLLNVANGTVDLRTGRLHPHDREEYHSKMVAFDYATDALAPRLASFIDDITCGDVELAGYLQRFIGLGATGDTSVQLFHVLLGGGANGKSALLNTVSHVLGEYAHTAPAALLLDKGAGAATNDLVALDGKRWVSLSEAPDGCVVDTGRLKRLTGSEMITARRLYEDFLTFQPVAKFAWALNHMPRWDNDDAALWRRLRIIPFPRIFQPHEQDTGLGAALRLEAPGILSWIIEGAVAVLSKRLGTCDAVEAATAAARLEGDEVGTFLTELCEEDGSAAEDAGGLFRAYQTFAFENGVTAVSPTAFGRTMTRRGFPAGKRGGRRVRQGLRLRSMGGGR